MNAPLMSSLMFKRAKHLLSKPNAMKTLLATTFVLILALSGCGVEESGEDRSLFESIFNGPREAEVEVLEDDVVPFSNGPGDQLPTTDDLGE